MLLLQELNVLGKGKRSDMGDEWEYFFKSEKRILRVCYSKELGEYGEWNKVSAKWDFCIFINRISNK